MTEAPWCRDSGTRATDWVRSLGIGPVHVHLPSWANGEVTLSVYATDERPPDDLVVSTRCVVVDDEHVLVCENPSDTHVVPGGRREMGETWEQTARREVLEETGFSLGPMRQVAVVLLHKDGERPDDPAFTYPMPDAFWVVFAASPLARDDDTWADTEGWETSSTLVPIDEALAALDPLYRALLEAAL